MKQYLRRAARKLALFIHQNDLRLTNPELFTPLQPVARSPLKWTGKKAELYELLIALDNLDIITENGIKASFSSLVREFSRTVGLPYDTDCHNERRRILARNTRRTVFIDRLKKEGFKNDEIFSD
ncbi:MAG: RteC domain-containing protein [Candidatus Cryptobacteroides sp.]|nr:RteC domain-containing protein [Bacteroidales bacterium]MDI9472655.1 RteC domain-containing protein [Bacillota bacterium]MDY3226652.1 RteC domain-containing protein [Candidatus Cryptobacteroides sp.]MDY5890415.1 RteC domain-containing protein [Candidatus Cryptobacteroides sp.]